jgi:hypothetical protein
LTPLEGRPNQNIEGKGEEAFSEDEDFPEETGKQIGGPSPFRDMPMRGGGMAGDSAFHLRFPDAGRIGIDPEYITAGNQCRYDNFGRLKDASSPARNTKSGRGRPIALDEASSQSYSDRFPTHIKCL